MNQLGNIIMRVILFITVLCALIGCIQSPITVAVSSMGETQTGALAQEVQPSPPLFVMKQCSDNIKDVRKEVGIEIISKTSTKFHAFIINNSDNNKYYLAKEKKGYSPLCKPNDKGGAAKFTLTTNDRQTLSQSPLGKVSSSLDMLLSPSIQEVLPNFRDWKLSDDEGKVIMVADSGNQSPVTENEKRFVELSSDMDELLATLGGDKIKLLTLSSGCVWSSSSSNTSKSKVKIQCNGSPSHISITIPGFDNPILYGLTAVDIGEQTVNIHIKSEYRIHDEGNNSNVNGKITLHLPYKHLEKLSKSCLSQTYIEMEHKICFKKMLTIKDIVSSQETPLEISPELTNSNTISKSSAPNTPAIEQGKHKVILISLSKQVPLPKPNDDRDQVPLPKQNDDRDLDKKNSIIRDGLNKFFSQSPERNSSSLWVIEGGRSLLRILDFDTEVSKVEKLINNLSFSAIDLNAMDDLELVDSAIVRDKNRSAQQEKVGKILYLTDNNFIDENTLIPSRLLGIPSVWKRLYGIDFRVLTTGSCKPWQQAEAECEEWGNNNDIFKQFLTK